MATQPCCYVSIQNVAVATDFSDCSERAVLHAVAVTRKFGAALHFLNILQPSKFASLPEMIPEVHKAAARDCDQMISRLRSSSRLDGIDCHSWVEQGEIFEVVSEFVRNQHIDLLVVGTHGQGGITRFLFGSASQEFLHHVHCPVLTVGPCAQGAGAQVNFQRILFPTDLSSESLVALPYVLTAVREWRAELDVLHVCSAKDAGCPGLMPQRLSDLQARIESLQEGQKQVPIRYHQLAGKPAPSIIDFAGRNPVDLIVLGLKPPRALYSGSMWSHAYEVVRHARCPVLSVRSDLS